MSIKTGIEWTDATWNPVVGCERVSPGCAHCYAKTLHDQRHTAHSAGKQIAVQYAQPFEIVQLKSERLTHPLCWQKPRRVFVNSVSDLFHDDVPDEYIAKVFAVMALAYQHDFQVLTKRPRRMQELLSRETFCDTVLDAAEEFWPRSRHARGEGPGFEDDLEWNAYIVEQGWPLQNVWLGVSVENQRWANERVPLLVNTPAAHRFLSCEPLLGPVNLDGLWGYPGSADFEMLADWPITWVIAGAESGNGARPMQHEWVRSLRDQCREAAVKFMWKQDATPHGRKISLPVLDGRQWTEMPGLAHGASL